MTKIIGKSKLSRMRNQLFASITVNLLVVDQVLSVGWWSPTLLLYRSTESPLTDYISVDDASWISSIISLGAATGALSYGLLSKYIGCKTTLIYSGWPVFVSWILVMFASNPFHLYMARFFDGITGGSFLSQIPLFIAEIADKDVRGSLGSLLTISINIGILLGFILGTYVPYTYQPIVALLIPVLYQILFFHFPKTPQFLLKIGQVERCRKVYRNCGLNSKEDIEQLRIEFETLKDIERESNKEQRLRFKDFTVPSSIKALTIGPTLMALSQFTGAFTMMSYAGIIFKESGSTIDPNISAIVLVIIQICGAFCCIIVIDKVGRKILLVVSASGSSIGLFIMGCYSYMSKHDYDVGSLNLVPVVSLSFVILISSIGLSPVPHIITAEILPLKLRRCGVIFSITMNAVFAFTMLKLFPILMTSIELYGCMWLCMAVGLIGLLFVIIVVEETRGTNLNEHWAEASDLFDRALGSLITLTSLFQFISIDCD